MMKRINYKFIIFILFTFVTTVLFTESSFAFTGGNAPGNFSKLAKEVKPGVVNIRTEKTVKSGGGFNFYGGPNSNDELFKKL